MTLTLVGLALIILFVIGSMIYVYKYRGHARFENFTEYLRKGWPLFTPLNCLLYIFTQPRAKTAIMSVDKFPELKALQDNWQTIREEAVSLYEKSHFDNTKKPGAAGYYDVGFRTFFKYGWSKFYLKWYGYTHNSAQNLCPKTVEILKNISTVNGAMFSILPAGSQLTRHLDPVACSLRYHLGLSTPNADACFINVDGQQYSWRDGQAFIFDETYLHYAKNNSDRYRIILMCDVERPMFLVGSLINFIFKILMRVTVVPNMEGDKRGFANQIFSSLAPILQKSKNLKQSNRPAYLALKYTVNFTLIIIAVALTAGILNFLSGLAHLLFS